MLIENIKKWSDTIIGKRLKSVHGLLFLFDGNVFTDHPQEISLNFESTSFPMKLVCGSDGSSLLISDQPMIEDDMEGYGKNVIKDLSEYPNLSPIIGKTLTCFNAINSSVEDSIIGFKFDFCNDIELVILNLGDEIYILNALPKNILDEECIKYTLINKI